MLKTWAEYQKVYHGPGMLKFKTDKEQLNIKPTSPKRSLKQKNEGMKIKSK